MADVTSRNESPQPDPRRQALERWLAAVRPDVAGPLEPASGDASFRRYFRVPVTDGSVIAMDAPPGQEETHPFVDIAGRLAAAGLTVPAILAHDPDAGFLLLGDLGRTGYMERLDTADARALMDAAVAALVRMQATVDSAGLPAYDAARLAAELDLFPEWYVRRQLGVDPGPAWWRDWSDACARLVERALAQPRVFVHRDYMPRNLMVTAAPPGILDFQDAVAGPITYDLASLLRDAFVSWPAADEARWIEAYLAGARAAGLPVPADAAAFRADLDAMAAQRHLKVLGIFARLCHRDGKPRYIADAPRFHAYLERETADDPGLAPLRAALAALPRAAPA